MHELFVRSLWNVIDKTETGTMISSEEKDRGRLIELVKTATSEEVQNHLDAFDGHKIIVDYDGQGEEDIEEEESRPRGFSDLPSDQRKAFEDGLRA